jgi:hypothetical protein
VKPWATLAAGIVLATGTHYVRNRAVATTCWVSADGDKQTIVLDPECVSTGVASTTASFAYDDKTGTYTWGDNGPFSYVARLEFLAGGTFYGETSGGRIFGYWKTEDETENTR